MFRQSLKWSVTVCSFIVHYQFTLHKIETVWNCFKRTFYHLLNQLLRKIWQLVNSLQWILGFRHAERHLKFIRFYQLSFEIVSLDHQEFFNWLISNSKLKCGPNGIKLEELGTEMILNESCRVRYIFANSLLRFPNFK